MTYALGVSDVLISSSKETANFICANKTHRNYTNLTQLYEISVEIFIESFQNKLLHNELYLVYTAKIYSTGTICRYWNVSRTTINNNKFDKKGCMDIRPLQL